ncbi:hypothetical protein GCM10007175_16940 [Pseudarthrobacter scleromae]|uniref:Uncharacterized protein n=1 Tax=Pseudarthrobacter scleromae TaxID=158897 RepID=A0ABQ2CG28_9MICC|nr:hypothetical protein GCM10007175_16940 [Pseudarthrobacter scleromae]
MPAGQQSHQQRFTQPGLPHNLRVKAAGNIRRHLLCPGQFRGFDSRGRTGRKHWIFPLVAELGVAAGRLHSARHPIQDRSGILDNGDPSPSAVARSILLA